MTEPPLLPTELRPSALAAAVPFLAMAVVAAADLLPKSWLSNSGNQDEDLSRPVIWAW